MAIVNTNFNSIFAASQYTQISRAISESTLKISSGKRVIHAGDDPSSLQIITNLTKDTRAYDVANNRNTTEVLALLQTSYTALGAVKEMLLDMQDLALRAINDATLTPADYGTLEAQYQEYITQIDKTVKEAEFNGRKLLEGTYSGPGDTLQGPGTYSQEIDIPDADNQLFNVLNLDGTSIANAGLATAALPVVENSLTYIANVQTLNGFQVDSLTKARTVAEDMRINLLSALSNVEDVDLASEIARFAELQITSQAAIAMMAQANTSKANVIDILDSLPQS